MRAVCVADQAVQRLVQCKGSMSGVVEHLATLTGSRDRDVLDVTLVSAFRDLLRPQLVAIYRCVGEPGRQRWLTRAHLLLGDVAATADPLWADPITLAPLDTAPDRVACMSNNQPLAVAARAGEAARTYLPLDGEHEWVGVLEIHSAAELDDEALRLVGAVLRVYRNFRGLLDYSERDTLTGLLNRKTFDACFLRLVEQVLAAEKVVAPTHDRRNVAASSVWLGVVPRADLTSGRSGPALDRGRNNPRTAPGLCPADGGLPFGPQSGLRPSGPLTGGIIRQHEGRAPLDTRAQFSL